MKNIIFTSGIGILGVFALLGIFMSAIIAHEYTHVLQSKDAVSINYDMQQGSFAHIMHDVKAWGNNHEFKAFVEQSENSADIVESGTGYFASFFLGGSLFYLIFGRKEE